MAPQVIQLVTAGPWDELITRHDRTVWLSVVAFGIAPEQAREITQATWARLIEQHGRGALASLTLPGLAITQARFLALDALRRTRRETRAGVELGCETEVIDAVDPERQAIAREGLRKAAAALAQCSVQEQRVFRGCYDDPPRPHAELAVELGLSLQRVRQILCEVRRKLRDAMEA